MTPIKVEIIESHFLEITIQRSEKRNALNRQVIDGVLQALNSYENNSEIYSVTICSDGDIFCSGADLEMLQQISKNSYEENLEDSSFLASLFKKIYLFPKPIIAKVQGPAIAGGCGLAVICDFVYASEKATFSYPEVNIGFIPAVVSFFLIRKVGEGHARHLLLTGKAITASEAKKIGMITEVFQPNELSNKVDEFRKWLKNTKSPEALAQTKKLINNMSSQVLDSGLEIAATMNAEARGTADCFEGIAAFLEKRKPEFGRSHKK